MTYTDANVQGINENSLLLFYWDTNTETWLDAASTCSPKSPYIRNLEQNTLSVQICHLTEFALMGNGRVSVFLPIIQR